MLNIDGNDLARRIDAYCNIHGISKETLTKETGISSANLSQWRTGINNPSMKKIRAIEHFTGIPIEEFMAQENFKVKSKEKSPAPMSEGKAYWAERLSRLSPSDQALLGAVVSRFEENPEATRSGIGLLLGAVQSAPRAP